MFKVKHGFNRRSERDSLKRKFYDRWRNMHTRCFNKNRKDWKNYGGRGITIDNQWLDFQTFKNDMYRSFLSHTKKYGIKDTTLERIDVNKNYSKENCRWATKLEQRYNSRGIRYVIYKDKTYTLPKLAKLLNRPYSTIHSRLMKGIDIGKPFRKTRSKATKNL